jgi:hypothetical protein
MAALHLKAIVTADRQLKLDLPTTLPVGSEVEVTLELEPTWTEEELAELMKDYHHPTPMTGAEIVALLNEMGTTGWEHIQDSGEWVAEQRRKSAKRAAW